jgi:DNA-binding winged helix-turn-helix (wHTH) protein
VTTDPRRPCRLRFGIYEIDARAGELWREGLPVHLPPQPFKVLFLLASRAGDVVTREEIRQELWGNDTFVDFDGGLNFCINQIRKALRDNAESPRFIHTLPRRGYRFIASVDPVPLPAAAPESAAEAATTGSATGSAGPVAPGGGEPTGPDDDDGQGGPPRARAGHLYEVVREAEGGRRWRPGGMPGLVRLTASPVALQDPEPPAAGATAVAPMPEAVPAPDAAPERRDDRTVTALATPRPSAAARPVWALAAAVLALLAAVVAIVVARRGRPEAAYERLTFRRGTVSSVRFGHAGEIVYAATWDGGPRLVYVTRPGETVARALDLPERAQVVRVLASGELAVLLRRGPRCVLALAPSTGGTPREIVDDIATADASADGARVAVVRTGPEDRVELPPGHEIHRAAAKLNSLRLSPAGDRVAFLSHPVPGDDRGEVVTVDAAGRTTVLSRDWASLEGLAWSPSGREVWFTGAKVGADSTLNAVTLSGSERVVTRGPGRLVLHDIRSDGAVLLERATRRTELRGRFGPEAAERDLSWLDLSMLTDLAPDGRTVVFSESGEGGGATYGVFLRATDGSPPVRLGEGRAMTLSPDGRWVLTMPLFGPPRIVALPTGAGEPRTLATGFTRHAWAGWLPDSRRVVFTAAEADRPVRAFVQDLEGGAARPLTGEVALTSCVVSPDGRLLVARRPGPSGEWQFHPVEGGTPSPAPIGTMERPLVFTADGRGLFVVPFSLTGPLVVERVDLATGARSRWMEVTGQDKAVPPPMRPFAITPDGRSYAYNVHRILSELYLVRGLF